MTCNFKYSKICSIFKRYIAVGNDQYKGELCQDCFFWIDEGEIKMLKEIKTRYATNCAKCNREIKAGWTVFFNPDDKKIYCKPCGTPMQKTEIEEAKKNPKTQKTDKGVGIELLVASVAQARLNGDLLASLDDRIKNLCLDVSHLDSFIRDIKKVAPTKAKK